MLSPASLLRCLLHTILPVQCTICQNQLWEDPVPFFCRACWETMTPIGPPTCPRCDRPFSSPVALQHSPLHVCQPCRTQPPAFTQAWTGYAYQTPLKEAIRLFKYHGKVSLAKPLGHLLGAHLSPQLEIDYIIPVPLHPSRLREREYNQSLLLADQVSRHIHTPVLSTTLLRVICTPPQTTLPRSLRLKNLRRAFQIHRPHRIRNKRILLIDDVMTTGTTVNECAKALRRAGADHVYVSTVARMV